MNIFQVIRDSYQKVQALQEIIPSKIHKERIAEIDELTNNPKIWDDNRKAAALLKERQSLVSLLDKLSSLTKETILLMEYAETFPEEMDSFNEQVQALAQAIENFELSQLLNGKHDRGNAIVTITSGAGGIEAKNFVMMLSRMYMRYADSMGWKVEILDEKPSDEYSDICLDNISLQIIGENAYGYLKGEIGVMRLIRNSPFNSGDARHTSFAAVSVMPDIEDEIEIEIKESDVEIQAIRSSSAGGQNVNKVSTCIRLFHEPSGIMIKAQTERSQLENKKIAFRLLKAKLYERELKKREVEQEKMLAEQANVAFGHQVRTYTLSPFKLVKNHKSGFESNQAEEVLDGKLHQFILDNLKKTHLK